MIINITIVDRLWPNEKGQVFNTESIKHDEVLRSETGEIYYNGMSHFFSIMNFSCPVLEPIKYIYVLVSTIYMFHSGFSHFSHNFCTSAHTF